MVARATDVVWFDGQHPVTYQVEGRVAPVVHQAISMFCSDMELVTGQPATPSNRHATIRIVQGNGSDDGFSISVSNGQLVVRGHNPRGTAYALLELSRMAGVSPWVWWGDVVPLRQQRLAVDASFSMEHTPSVAYRGIFINDEDWSLRNWAWKNYEGGNNFGTMGPKTYKALFQLLLRLRANTLWPAMHPGTPAFFTVPGNKAMADSFAIVIGSSHCEPLLRNNVAEWNHDERGSYNYMTNRDQVQQYWAERLKQVKGSEELFTIGMRGIHDGSMEGVKTSEEKLAALQQVIDDQRQLIGKYYNTKVEQVAQVFIPYKEVLEIMESGLRVPDDVTLMWCDDNYGYLTRLSDDMQQQRSGGAGIYYHLSYWGRPHDYLWLTTTQPGLIFSEMKAAYDHNCRRLWIANVHDPKAAAYQLELFLDMAWNMACVGPTTVNKHLEEWLCTQFGQQAGKRLFPAMCQFYRLCAIRRPEFMGWTQVELADRKAYPRGRSQVVDTEFSQEAFGNELESYLADFADVCATVTDVEATLRPALRDAYFAHVKYPVLAANAMAVKMLEAQKARSLYQGQSDSSAVGRHDYMLQASARSMQAYRLIQQLTDYYNNQLASGKWKGLMNMQPRDLNVFNPPILPAWPPEGFQHQPAHYQRNTVVTDAVARNAAAYTTATPGCQPVQMLGHSMNAVAIPKGGELTFQFESPRGGQATLYTAMIPTQPNGRNDDLRYQVTGDNGQPVVISLKEKYRSEFWKLSVLRQQALKQTPVELKEGTHTLTIKALDHHIVMDQWMIDFNPQRKFYVIPAD